jgi:hypothetical protein
MIRYLIKTPAHARSNPKIFKRFPYAYFTSDNTKLLRDIYIRHIFYISVEERRKKATVRRGGEWEGRGLEYIQ